MTRHPLSGRETSRMLTRVPFSPLVQRSGRAALKIPDISRRPAGHKQTACASVGTGQSLFVLSLSKRRKYSHFHHYDNDDDERPGPEEGRTLLKRRNITASAAICCFSEQKSRECVRGQSGFCFLRLSGIFPESTVLVRLLYCPFILLSHAEDHHCSFPRLKPQQSVPSDSLSRYIRIGAQKL